MPEIYVDPQIRALRELLGDAFFQRHCSSGIVDSLAFQAEKIIEGHSRRIPAITFQLACWCPDFMGSEPEQILGSSLKLSQAQLTIAREHGYTDWSDVVALENDSLESEFEILVEAVLQGDIAKLQECMDINRALVTQRSQYGHRATLLHYIGANGVESYRQMTPMNACEVARTLIEAGADVNATAEMYGGGSTTLGLVLSSAHPYKAGVTRSLADVLRAAGAV